MPLPSRRLRALLLDPLDGRSNRLGTPPQKHEAYTDERDPHETHAEQRHRGRCWVCHDARVRVGSRRAEAQRAEARDETGRDSVAEVDYRECPRFPRLEDAIRSDGFDEAVVSARRVDPEGHQGPAGPR